MEYIRELESAIEQGKLLATGDQDKVPEDDHDNDKDYDYDSGSENSSDSGSYDIVEDIDFNITCLKELGPSLEQNLIHGKRARIHESYPIILDFFIYAPAMTYVSLVDDKFPKADYKLVNRLGEANWQRHKSVREKIDWDYCSDEVARSIYRPCSNFHDSRIGTSAPALTDCAQSHSSFRSSNTEGEKLSLRVPREPSEVSAGTPFQCFLCRCIISNVKNRVDWK